jgi:amino acid transporter
MSESLMKMWISLAGMGFMFLSIILIYFSRYKLKGIFKILTGIIAYILMILSGIIIFFVVVSGPTG